MRLKRTRNALGLRSEYIRGWFEDIQEFSLFKFRHCFPSEVSVGVGLALGVAHKYFTNLYLRACERTYERTYEPAYEPTSLPTSARACLRGVRAHEVHAHEVPRP